MFTGLYFDGQSSRSHQVIVELLPDSFHITSHVATSAPIDVLWDIDKIHQGHYTNTSKLTIKYGDFPHQYLEVNDPDFFASLGAVYPGKKFNAHDFQLLNHVGLKGVLAISIGFVAIVVLAYLYVLPPITEFMAAQMPQSMEEKLGNQMYDQFTDGVRINGPLTKQANEFWRALHVESPYTINITVVDAPVPNAFALPGGQIIVFDSIIRSMKDYDEFAGLLAHEYTHVIRRHSTRMMSRNLAAYIFISVLLNDASGTVAVLAGNANSLKSLSFSRNLEHQADEGGYELLRSRDIDPDGMLKLFTTLKKIEGNSTVPSFISTHPLTTDRISFIEDKRKKDKTIYSDQHEDLRRIWQEMKSDEDQ